VHAICLETPSDFWLLAARPTHFVVDALNEPPGATRNRAILQVWTI
jgi:hypothetical protein